jgi:hypothetical protein
MANRAPVNADAINGGGTGVPYTRLTGGGTAAVLETSVLARMRGLNPLWARARAVRRSATVGRLRPLASTVQAAVQASGTLSAALRLDDSAATAAATATAQLGVLRVLLPVPAVAAAHQDSAIDVDPVIEVFPPGQWTAAAIATGGALNSIATLVPTPAVAQANATAELVLRANLLPVTAVALARAESGSLASLIDLGTSHAIAQVNAYGETLVAIVTEKEPPYRTVSIPNDDASKRPRTFQRQPGDFLPYDVDLEKWLEPFPGDGIESVQVTVTEATGTGADVDDLDVSRIDFVVPQIQSPALPAIRAKVWVEGGIAGALYKVTVRCTTIGDRVKEVDFRLSVNEV